MAENYTEQEIEQKVKEVVAQLFNVDPEQITRDTSFTNDLGADSLDQVEFLMGLEETFDTQIPPEEAEKVETVGQAIEYLKRHLEQTQAQGQS